jgi:hypothetical protein
MLRPLRFLCCVVLCSLTLPAAAGMAEVRDAARQSNCPPKKIEILRQAVGTSGETLYQVECNLPKAKDQPSAATRIIVKCQMLLCQMLR